MNAVIKPVLLTSLAMIAFASNSVIARLALLEQEIGPWSYTSVRLLSGAVILALIAGPVKSWKAGSWTGAAYLLNYAGFFSLAYISLPAGIGALILFTAVQATMIGSGLINGERLSVLQWCGATLAFLGLIILLNPGQDAPSIWGTVLMISSGIGWGLYSLKGRSSKSPTSETSGNFVKACVLTTIIIIPIWILNPEPLPGYSGIVLAVISGALTSGLGYAIWYTALPYLSATRAGIAQLTVPVIAAIGGILFLAEPISNRLVVSSLAILLGVGVATLIRSEKR